ncbi:MAG: fluoride efflux transporter CrcB [Chloroflexi bacterium]|nr:fluoride efflux transporter CrcB [Chloroflexota bacterium]
MRQLETLLVIGLGGFFGANARYLISTWAAGRFGQNFPWGTMLINFTGSCLLAVFLTWATSRAVLDPRLRLFVAVGFFGAYTTFSTFANDSVALLQAGNWAGALGNILGTNLICILGAVLGVVIGAKLSGMV